MGVIFDVPKYPVIDPAPSHWRTMKNYGWKEWGMVIGTPLVIAPFGYNWGVQPRVPIPSMYCTMLLGLIGGTLLAHQQSWGRLMGLLPNDREVELYMPKDSPNKAG